MNISEFGEEPGHTGAVIWGTRESADDIYEEREAGTLE